MLHSSVCDNRTVTILILYSTPNFLLWNLLVKCQIHSSNLSYQNSNVTNKILILWINKDLFKGLNV